MKIADVWVCLDCDEMFKIEAGNKVCPACANKKIYSLNKWIGEKRDTVVLGLCVKKPEIILYKLEV